MVSRVAGGGGLREEEEREVVINMKMLWVGGLCYGYYTRKLQLGPQCLYAFEMGVTTKIRGEMFIKLLEKCILLKSRK